MADNLKEYIVTLHRHEDLNDFYEDMETPGGSLYIPNRRVECANRREISRNTHYYLTFEEVLQLQNDPRVMGVDPIDDLTPTPLWEEYDTNYNKSPGQSDDRNWALLRCVEGNHRRFWTSGSEEGYIFGYREGKNVDVVIFDGIIDPAHPEFAVNSNGTGGSRVIRENWYSYVGLAGSYPYDTILNAGLAGGNEHGIHVAATVAGNRQGWARKANIYNIDVYTSTGQFNSIGWDAVRAWHRNKPINPLTGVKNPTVTNHSYGVQFSTKVSDISQIKYRGTRLYPADFASWTRAEWEERGFYEYFGTLYGGARYTSAYLADQEDAIADGIIVVAAGGNGKNILALPTDPDFENQIWYTGFYNNLLPVSYCKGMGHSYNAIIVGNIGTSTGSDSTKEPLSESSSKGGALTLYAPGTSIFSAGYLGSIGDPRNSSFKLVSKTGTSMASPQVAGVLACAMEKYPSFTQSQAKQYIIDNAKTDQISENDLFSRSNALFSLGTPDRYLFYPTDLNEGAPVSATITPSSTSINEGQSVTFDINTSYILSGTVLNWKIVSSTGTLSSSDFEDGLTQGTLTIENREASLTKTLTEDFTTEGNEAFSLQLSLSDGTVIGTSNPVTVVDTSKEPKYYISSDKTNVDEGGSVTFTVTTEGVEPGTVLVWVVKDYIDYAQDIEDVADTFTISGTTASGSGSFTVDITEDFKTEGNEIFQVEIRRNSLTGTVVVTSNGITINDTSVDPTYSLSDPDKAYITEGETVNFTVSTTGIPPDTVLYWTTTGAVSAADFSDNSLSGTVTITGTRANGTGTITRTLVNDRLTEGGESFYLNLKVGSTSGGTVATSGGVVIEDTSLSPSYSLTANKNSTTESSNITITLTTTNVDNNTLVPYAIYGANVEPGDFIDRIQLTGNFNVVDNTSKFVLTLNPDSITEGPEAAYVRLTGPGRTETVGFTIQDTSTAPPDDRVYFYISSSASSIREGSYLTFTVAATGVDTNLTVPYEILGIAAQDLLDPSSIRGNIILTYDPFAIISPTEEPFTSPANMPPTIQGVASGSITIGILENFKTDGLRTVLLNLTPDYSYEIRITSTIQIIDTSPDTDPRYQISFDKYSVIEGSNVVVTVDTFNVQENAIVIADILAFSNSKITIADFVGLSNLSIVFPPTSPSLTVPGSNSASYTLQVADDFVFEQPEYFYLGIRGSIQTSGLVQILDSGNSLVESQEIYTGNASITFVDKAVLQANLGGFTIGQSVWEDTSGMLSEKIYVQGKTPFAGPEAPPFYQPFSYVIRSNKSIDLWRASIKDMIHPAGLALFSEISNETQPADVLKATANNTVDSEISDFFALTADNRTPPFYVSSNLYSNSRFEVALKSDFAYYIHKYF